MSEEYLRNRLGYRKMLKKAGFEQLGERRVKALDMFAVNAAKSVAFRHWFPRKIDHHGGRQCKVCIVFRAN